MAMRFSPPPQIVFAFCSPPCYFPLRDFNRVLGMTSCSKTETCHPECIDEVAQKSLAAA